MCVLGVGVSSQNEITNNDGLVKGPDLFKEMQQFSLLRYKLTGGSSINNLNVWLNSCLLQLPTFLIRWEKMEGNFVESSSFVSSFNTHTHLHRVTVLMINPSDFHLKQIRKIIKDTSKNHSSNWQVEQTYKGLLSPAHHL